MRHLFHISKAIAGATAIAAIFALVMYVILCFSWWGILVPTPYTTWQVGLRLFSIMIWIVVFLIGLGIEYEVFTTEESIEKPDK